MHTFEVWAPLADSLTVEAGGHSHPMKHTEGGWWRGPVKHAGPGTDYVFRIDGGNPAPDPRSSWQPEGVNGPSRLVDHLTFPWSDRTWNPRPLSSAILYEIHVGTFTQAGTFLGVIERLDYLVELGVTHIELMPVNEFSGPWGWGYDGVDLYAPHYKYGTPDDLKTLIDACHNKGLAVILDVVYNHFGPVGNYLSQFGPYFTDAYKTPWGTAVNLDAKGSHEVRRFFIDNALMWLRDYHFDGLRLDAVHAFVDSSALHFLEQLSEEVNALSSQLGKYLFLIAESDLNNPRIVRSREAGGYGIDAHWNDEFHHALHALLTGEQNGYYEDFGSLDHLVKAFESVYVYDGNYSVHRDRMHGRPATGLSGHHFVVFSQNHDQVGNRAQGERLSQLLSPGRQKIAAAVVLTSPFVPLLFQGEEFAASSPFLYFSQHEDPELAKAVSEGRRREFSYFGWKPEEVPDPQGKETFERSMLRWEEVSEEPHAQMLHWYKQLIALRSSNSAFTDGRLDRTQVRAGANKQWLTVKRGSAQIVINLAADSQAVPIDAAPDHVVSSEAGWQLRPGLIEMAGESVAILLPSPSRVSELAPESALAQTSR